MNIALTHIHAAIARFDGRRAVARAVVMGCALAGGGASAFAGQDRDQDRGPRNASEPQGQFIHREQPRAERMAPAPQRAQQRQFDAPVFDVRAEEQRRAPQQEQGARRGGRLTPDERRELRRQINEAGIDLYPSAPRR